MDKRVHLAAPSYDTLSTAAPETQWNVHIFTPTLKQEMEECIDEEESSQIKLEYPSEPLESSEYVNHYYSKSYGLKGLKKEFPDDECPGTGCSVKSEIDSENKDSSKLVDGGKLKNENSEEGLLLNIKEEDKDIKYQFTLKVERVEEQGILDTAGDNSMHYDAPMTPQKFECKLRHRTFKNSETTSTKTNAQYCKEYRERKKLQNFERSTSAKTASQRNKEYRERLKFQQKSSTISTSAKSVAQRSKEYRERKKLQQRSTNSTSTSRVKKHRYKNAINKLLSTRMTDTQPSFNLLKRNNDEHIKCEINTPGDNETNELHQCQYCEKRFDNRDNMLAHISDVHSKTKTNCELCGKQFKSVWNVKRHILSLHKLKKAPKQVTQNRVKEDEEMIYPITNINVR